MTQPIPVAERPKASVCGLSLAGVAGSNPSGSVEVSVAYCTVRTKRKMQDNKDKETSTDEVQTEYKRIPKINFRWGHECLSLLFVLCCAGRSLCDGPITRPGESYRVYVSDQIHLQWDRYKRFGCKTSWLNNKTSDQIFR
jgi:hypothetical protein